MNPTNNQIKEEKPETLPSLRNKQNSLLTILGIIAILIVAVPLIVYVNKDNAPKEKKAKTENAKNENSHPKLTFPEPAAPPVLNTAPAATAQPVTPVFAQNTQPVNPHNSNIKPPIPWTERKMMGGLLVSKQQNGSGSASQPPPPNTEVPPDYRPGKASAYPNANPQTQNDRNNLGSNLKSTSTPPATATLLPDRNFLITKGTTLDCALETALDSSVPGITTCRLTRDIYSDNGQVLLLDRGSSLVGEYQGGLKQGQARIFVLWTRVKTPDGVIISLNSPGTDALGRSGLDGFVDNHFWQRFGAAILMSTLQQSLSIIANKAVPSNGGGTTNIYGGSMQGGERVVEKILESTVNIPPTIIKNQGDHIQVMVARDLDFSEIYGLEIKND